MERGVDPIDGIPSNTRGLERGRQLDVLSFPIVGLDDGANLDRLDLERAFKCPGEYGTQRTVGSNSYFAARQPTQR